MFDSVYATRFIRPITTGKTAPFLIECEDGNGESIEVFVKYSSGTMQGTLDLAIEAVAGMLATDLDPYVFQALMPSGGKISQFQTAYAR